MQKRAARSVNPVGQPWPRSTSTYLKAWIRSMVRTFFCCCNLSILLANFACIPGITKELLAILWKQQHIITTDADVKSINSGFFTRSPAIFKKLPPPGLPWGFKDNQTQPSIVFLAGSLAKPHACELEGILRFAPRCRWRIKTPPFLR